MDLDWDQPTYPPEDESLGAAPPSIPSIRVVGEALEPSARRAAELAALEAKLRDHPDDADALFDRGGSGFARRSRAKRLPTWSGACISTPTTTMPFLRWLKHTARRTIRRWRGQPWRGTWRVPLTTPMPAS